MRCGERHGTSVCSFILIDRLIINPISSVRERIVINNHRMNQIDNNVACCMLVSTHHCFVVWRRIGYSFYRIQSCECTAYVQDQSKEQAPPPIIIGVGVRTKHPAFLSSRSYYYTGRCSAMDNTWYITIDNDNTRTGGVKHYTRTCSNQPI